MDVEYYTVGLRHTAVLWRHFPGVNTPVCVVAPRRGCLLKHHCFWPFPVTGLLFIGVFDFRLYRFVDVWKEGETCDSLHFAYAVGVKVSFAGAFVVAADVSYAPWMVGIEAGNNFEKGFWFWYPVFSDTVMFLIHENRSTDNIDISIFFRPLPASFLNGVPYTTVQRFVLGTDVCHQETLIHCLFVPFVVAGGTHVASVNMFVFFISIIPMVSLGFRNIFVFVKGQVGTRHVAINMLGSKMPGDPVGLQSILVVR